MLRFSNKKKIILLAGLVIILSGLVLAFFDLRAENSIIKNFAKKIDHKTTVFAQEAIPFFIPRYPQRLVYLAGEILAASEELSSLNEEFSGLVQNCGCQNAESLCKSEKTGSNEPSQGCKPGLTAINVFGEPCPQKAEINERRSDINYKIVELASLRKLLDLEMNLGLEEELQTLRNAARADIADNLKTSLDNLIPAVDNILSEAQANSSASPKSLVQACQPTCNRLGTAAQLCATANIGQHKTNKVNFKAGVKLDNWDLGKVTVRNINLSLPETIKIPALPKIPAFSSPISDIVIDFPLTKEKNIVFHPPSPNLPDPPSVSFNFPNPPNYQSYQCSANSLSNLNDTKQDWFFQTFSWLSEKCQTLPNRKIPTRNLTEREQEELNRRMSECFNPNNVHRTIISECDILWNNGIPIAPVVPICHSRDVGIGIVYGLSKYEAIQRECRNLLGNIPDCNLDYYNPADSALKKIIPALETECDKRKQDGVNPTPEPCKFLPLFTGEFEIPEGLNYSVPGNNCPAGSMADYPSGFSSLKRGSAFPTVPKISFPGIKIPDITTPSIGLPPFFSVKLPNFIFEDLPAQELKLCDLDECQNIFPNLSFEPPKIKIPRIEEQRVSLNIPDMPPINLKISPIEIPFIPFNFPQLFNLGSIATPELQMPEIKLPQPKLFVNFKGVNIDLLNVLLGFIITQPINLSACVRADFGGLNVSFPDYVFSWPEFPRIPEIPFCSDLRTFCQTAKTNLKEVTNKKSQIEKEINEKLNDNVQKKLDQISPRIKTIMEEKINEQLRNRSDFIKRKIRDHMTLISNGAIPENAPLVIPLDPIIIPEIDLDALARQDGLPTEISIPWPESLKKIVLDANKDLSYPLVDENKDGVPDPLPFSRLGYEEEFSQPIPGLQESGLSINLNYMESYPSCAGGRPAGGNPWPSFDIETNTEDIKNVKNNINNISKTIKNLLQ